MPELPLGRADLLVPKWSIALLLFFLAGANGYRFWWSSMPLGFAVLAVMFAYRAASNGAQWRVPSAQVMLFGAFAAFACAGLSSWLATGPDASSTAMFLGAYLTPLLVFLGLQGLGASRTVAHSALTAMFIGAGFVLAHGLYRFYIEFGVPTGLELFFARGQEGRIATYMRATFGNVGSTSSFMALVLPPAIVVALSRAMPRTIRLVAVVTFLLGALNFAITQSRTLLVVLCLSIAAITLALRVRLAAVAIVVITIVGIVLVPLLAILDEILEYLLAPIQGSASDASASERSEAISAGWRTMLENPFHGVGPGRTINVNPYTSAHQFWVQHGSEAGVPGLVVAVVVTLIAIAVAVKAAIATRHTRDPLPLALSIGPGAYTVFAVLANVPLAQGSVNSWAALYAALLTLAAGFSVRGNLDSTDWRAH